MTGKPSSKMCLKELRLKDFRSFKQDTIAFHDRLTVLVGENNAGKSNIIDALRLISTTASRRRDRYAETDDIRRGSAEFRIDAVYSALSDTQKGMMVTALTSATADEALWGIRYKNETGRADRRARPEYFTGSHDGNEAEPEARDYIQHVYLPPLRDAVRVLSSSRGFEIAALLKHLATGTSQIDDLLDRARTSSANVESAPVIEAANRRIGEGLSALAEGARPQVARLGFTTPTLDGLARDLRFRLGDKGMDPGELSESGLGYANLLFMAFVLVELETARNAELTLFLVEEPEAHLHPALQTVVLDFLREKAEESFRSEVKSDQPAGAIQVIVTTHSPLLASVVSPRHIVIVKSAKETGKRSNSVSIPLNGLGQIEDSDMRKIERYLDATRSALLFAPRVVLVEGISEAIIITAIARRNRAAGIWTREQFARFLGCTLVSIQGVDFAPYIKILLSPSTSGQRVSERVIVITDGDAGKTADRKVAFDELARTLVASDRLSVFTNPSTLEHSLFTAGNEPLLKKTFTECHKEDGWPSAGTIEAKATEFVELMTTRQERKGDFAQRLALRIELKEEDFTIPFYLEDALKVMVDG